MFLFCSTCSAIFISMVTIIDRNYGPEPVADGVLARQARQTRGRGARSNQSGRFEAHQYSPIESDWQAFEEIPALQTSVQEETARKIITKNTSPDLAFEQSINPYRGCEHGCSYCFARPTHAFLGLSAGLDFESKLFAKTNAARRLRQELTDRKYKPKTIVLGSNTDPYQPLERQRRITREILEVLADFNHPVAIITKSALVTRDIDILSDMAKSGLAKVALSVTTLDKKLARSMEPRASTPERRLKAIETLAKADIPVLVMAAPIIPALNDAEIEAILKAAAGAGALEASYVLLRLPLEVRDIFTQWLQTAYPDKAAHVLSLMRSMHGGKEYDATWGKRMRGTGPYAWSIGRRFELAAQRLKLNTRKSELNCDLFTRPETSDPQLSLFAGFDG